MNASQVRSALILSTACLMNVTPCVAQEPGETKTVLSDLERHFSARAATPEQVEAWRKKFPYQSLAERLNYEQRLRGAAAPSLSTESEQRLNQTDKDYEDNSHWSYRATSLKMLHSMEVKEFIEKSGNGLSRTSPPGARYIEPQVPQLLALDKATPLSTEKDWPAPTTRLNGESSSNLAAAPLLRMLPSRTEASEVHLINQRLFADSTNFGYVQSLNRVAGFVSHGFSDPARSPLDAAQEQPDHAGIWHPHAKRWKVTRLELVSLLKHETARVYVSDHLPRMEELSSATAQTRELDAFEAGALKLLRDGEEIQTASTPNRIEMLGAVRASKQCMQCHEVPRGTLLGAFSYELRRDPPIKLAPTTPVVQ